MWARRLDIRSSSLGPSLFQQSHLSGSPVLVLAGSGFSPPEATVLPASLGQCRHSFQARGSCCQAGRHMLPSCFAISRNQGPRPFNFSKPQAFWWRAGFYACEPPAFGFLGTQTKCTYFQFWLWKRAFQCSGSLFHLALFFLGFLFFGGWGWDGVCAHFGLVCVPVFPYLFFFVPTKWWLRGRQHVEGPWVLASGKINLCLLLFISLSSQLCAHQKNGDFAYVVFCFAPALPQAHSRCSVNYRSEWMNQLRSCFLVRSFGILCKIFETSFSLCHLEYGHKMYNII